jgi:hypothetical protein
MGGAGRAAGPETLGQMLDAHGGQDRRSMPRWRVLAALLALVLALGAAVPAGTAATGSGPYRLDLYRAGDFVSQANDVQCIGASMQMMLNMILGTTDRTAARQLELQEIARAHSGRWSAEGWVSQDRERRGASSRGWVAGLRVAGGGSYRLVPAATLEEAVALAAIGIRLTGRPAGLLVWSGAHAWVMSGFEATGDPALDRSTAVTGVVVEDPWYPRVSRQWGASPRPGSQLTLAELGRHFVPWRRGTSTSTNSGRFVVVVPVHPDSRPGPRLVAV